MFLSLIRKETDDICTHGDLYIDGVWECHTLEDPIRPYPDKIAKRTAIWGDRTYTVTIDHSPKYGRDMLMWSTSRSSPGSGFIPATTRTIPRGASW